MKFTLQLLPWKLYLSWAGGGGDVIKNEQSTHNALHIQSIDKI